MGTRLLGLLDAVARRRGLVIGGCAAIVLVGSIVYAFLVRRPEPSTPAEFAHLLWADTFAEGRLDNPPHAMRRWLAAPLVLFEPRHRALVPPAPGVFLAAGQVVFGHPIAGMWIAGALWAAATAWMSYALLPARVTLVGSVLLAVTLGIPTTWTQTCSGGAAAALGATLTLGATARLIRRRGARDVLLFLAGIVLVAASFAGTPAGDLVPRPPRPLPPEWSRARIHADLEATGEPHLVIVRLGPHHDATREWIANAADVDLAPVVWARDLGAEANRGLLAYFRDRHVSLLEVGMSPGTASLLPYPK